MSVAALVSVSLSFAGILLAQRYDFSLTAQAAESGIPDIRTSHDGEVGEPWSKVFGGRDFDTISAVAQPRAGEWLFAGLSVPMDGQGESRGILVRSDDQGAIRERIHIEGQGLGQIAQMDVGATGDVRILHWKNQKIALAGARPDGQVVWSRVFTQASERSWAEIAAAGRGQTLVAMADAFDGGQVRIIRLDTGGRQVWRRDIDQQIGISRMHLADDGQGGAMIALSRSAPEADQVTLVRLDRRGRVAWSRQLQVDRPARLGAVDLDAAGGSVLIAGERSGLYVIDNLGRLVIARNLPGLDVNGDHVLSRMPQGGHQILAEPPRAGDGGRLWLARFDEDGRELWSNTRVNRMNASFRTLKFGRDGAMVAAGSVTDPIAGNTDMMIMSLADDGRFPSGYDSPQFEPREVVPQVPPLALLAEDGSGHAVITASLRSEPRVDTTEGGGLFLASDLSGPQRLQPARMTQAGAGHAHVQSRLRQISADEGSLLPALSMTATAKDRVLAPAAASASPKPSDVSEAMKKSRVSLTAETTPARNQVIRPAVSQPGERAAAVYRFRCTFTCMTDADGLVKYPVVRMFRDASENNAGLFALDVLAMDEGVCLASGGLVHDRPRLPPACEMVN